MPPKTAKKSKRLPDQPIFQKPSLDIVTPTMIADMEALFLDMDPPMNLSEMSDYMRTTYSLKDAGRVVLSWYDNDCSKAREKRRRK